MAITYPLDMPTRPRIASAPRLLKFNEARPEGAGGYPISVELGVPLWTIAYETTELSRRQFLEWEAWLDMMRGGVGYFKAIHPARKYPVTRPQGYAGSVKVSDGTPFDGTGVIDSVNIPNSRVRLTGLPNLAGWSGLAIGDVVSIAMTTQGRQLFRVTAANTQGAGVATLNDLVPLVTARIANGAAYTLVDPWFEATVDAGSIQKTDTTTSRRISFSATQILR